MTTPMTMRTTMPSRPSPWDGVPTPVADYTVVRVPNLRGVPIYWGRDISSQCLLIVELSGDHTDQLRSDGVTLNGIGVDMRPGDAPGRQGLVLTLARHVDIDLFQGLCETLIESLREVDDSATAMAVTLAQLKRWKAFLSGRRTTMPPEQVRGLFAELQMMRSLYAARTTPPVAVDAWCGADRVQQDFIFGDEAIEVKSLSGRERNSVRISSEDQLESLTSSLYLAVCRLTEMPESDQSVSLNDLVRQVEGELGDAQALEEFARKLSAYGYAPLHDYDSPRFTVSDLKTYRVEDGFPRLVRSGIPNGIARLSYDIELETIQPFECSSVEILGGA
ncbi:MAG: PD-(D/E)XK motif protein [Pseudomonadales bacterium]